MKNMISTIMTCSSKIANTMNSKIIDEENNNENYDGGFRPHRLIEINSYNLLSELTVAIDIDFLGLFVICDFVISTIRK